MILPLLSEFDPETKLEGSIDPLGTYPLADKLASRLIPGFRERMQRPRFLTAAAVGTVICNDFDNDRLASDEISPPWQVYEWYVVQALVRKYKGQKDIVGLPGSDKASQAWTKDLRLGASRYLKTPTVFGFHGVYRTLSTTLDIIDDTRLGEGGDRLIRAWEADQNLPGFYDLNQGEGLKFKNLISLAVKDGLERGEVSRRWNWDHFTTMAEHLVPTNIGKQEAKVLYDLILKDSTGYRQDVIPAIIEFLKNEPFTKEIDEGALYQTLLKDSNGELHSLLNSIITYEAFSRTLANAFEDILYCLSQNRRETDQKDFIELPSFIDGGHNIEGHYKAVLESFKDPADQISFQHSFEEFEHILNVSHFVETVIEHHRKVQKNKPPNGKLDWIVQTANGKWLIKPNYIRNENQVKSEDAFVHQYRAHSLRSFLNDLKKL